MKLTAAVLAMASLMWSGTASPQTRTERPLVMACVSSAETRDLFAADKLVPPFRVMREASRAAQAEAIDIQLCRVQGSLVYNVTLLDREGRIVHHIVSAANGVPFSPHGTP